MPPGRETLGRTENCQAMRLQLACRKQCLCAMGKAHMLPQRGTRHCLGCHCLGRDGWWRLRAAWRAGGPGNCARCPAAPRRAGVPGGPPARHLRAAPAPPAPGPRRRCAGCRLRRHAAFQSLPEHVQCVLRLLQASVKLCFKQRVAHGVKLEPWLYAYQRVVAEGNVS